MSPDSSSPDSMPLHPLSAGTRQALVESGLDPDAIADLVTRAIEEDLAGGLDVTSVATVPAEQISDARFTVRAPGVLAGLDVAVAVLETVCGPSLVALERFARDGDLVDAGQEVLGVVAPTRSMLTAERTALNLLSHLSGVATLTRRWADELVGTTAVVRDTRKTTPGLRALEKMAVRCGGGVNHRMALSDAALVKDNHVAAAGGVAAAFALVRGIAADLPVEIEVDDLAGLDEALAAGADLVLLDNFDVGMMRDAVAMRDRQAPGARLEASGGLSLGDARSVGETGVDFIAVGELTHSARVLDIGLDLVAVVTDSDV
jgi:nicotinate-nucleotide pyrophosphorylase (carboxylating)